MHEVCSHPFLRLIPVSVLWRVACTYETIKLPPAHTHGQMCKISMDLALSFVDHPQIVKSLAILSGNHKLKHGQAIKVLLEQYSLLAVHCIQGIVSVCAQLGA